MKIDNASREARFMSRKITTANHEALNAAYRATATGTPAETVAALVNAIGYAAAVDTVAELANSIGAWDGRISSRSRTWAGSIKTAATYEEMRGFYSIYSSIHPAHIDQIVDAMQECHYAE